MLNRYSLQAYGEFTVICYHISFGPLGALVYHLGARKQRFIALKSLFSYRMHVNHVESIHYHLFPAKLLILNDFDGGGSVSGTRPQFWRKANGEKRRAFFADG